MTKELKISRIENSNVDSSEVHELLDKNRIPWNGIDCNNWADGYPYRPAVAFRVAHNGKALLVEYEVREETVRAMADRNNDRPWEDSCCEFFIAPVDDGLYYNIECNCHGALLVACGKGREGRVQAPMILVAKGNFYKCGDMLSKPHFLSWNPIDTPSPDFHVPASFGLLTFE